MADKDKVHGIANKKTGRSRSTAHPAKTKSKIRNMNRALVAKTPKAKHQHQHHQKSSSSTSSSGDKTIMKRAADQARQFREDVCYEKQSQDIYLTIGLF
ncbi:MAG: hypothetical protein WB421_17205 [Terriglobales bacterium]